MYKIKILFKSEFGLISLNLWAVTGGAGGGGAGAGGGAGGVREGEGGDWTLILVKTDPL